MKHIPNILTFSRIGLLPFLICLLFIEKDWAVWSAIGLYTFASITDFLDGHLARKWNIESAVGQFLDPICDKIFVASILLALVATNTISGLWLMAVFIIFIREFLVSGLREYLGPKGVSIPVNKIAKWKTTIQMVAIGLLILTPLANETFSLFAMITLCIAALLTIITGWSYLRTGWQYIVK